MSVNIQEVSSYENYGRALQLSNSRLELLVSLDVGPRILFLRLDGGENLLWNDLNREMALKSPALEKEFGAGAQYYFYGGHRVWLAPQHEIKTCIPDNDPVEYKAIPQGAVFTCEKRDNPGIQMDLTIQLHPSKPEFSVMVEMHVLKDNTFAIWQITQMAPGGMTIVPFHRGAFDPSKVLVPRRQLSVFDFTDLQDERLYLGNNYITLKQIPGMKRPFKLGMMDYDGWCCYVNHGTIVTKLFDALEGAGYTDGGVNCEIYTGHAFMEIESLGSYAPRKAGESVLYTEHFKVQHSKLPVPASDNEEEIRVFLLQNGLEK